MSVKKRIEKLEKSKGGVLSREDQQFFDNYKYIENPSRDEFMRYVCLLFEIDERPYDEIVGASWDRDKQEVTGEK